MVATGEASAASETCGTDFLISQRMFFLGRVNDNFKISEVTDAIVYYGNIKDAKVPAVK